MQDSNPETCNAATKQSETSSKKLFIKQEIISTYAGGRTSDWRNDEKNGDTWLARLQTNLLSREYADIGSLMGLIDNVFIIGKY